MKEEYILSYGFLDSLGQRDVEEYVAKHPEYAALLAEARALYAAHQADSALPSELDLATRIVDEQLGLRDPAPPAAGGSREKAMRTRLEGFRPVRDPVDQYELLTGHRLPATDRAPAAERPPARSTPSRTRRRLAGAAFLVFIAAIALPSLHLRSIDRLAFMPESDLRLDGYSDVLRGEQPTDTNIASDQLYRYALAAFQYARNPGMGLFPRYDPTELARAEALLRRVVEAEPATSFLGQEARNTLAHVLLARSEWDEARVWLAEVASGSSRHAPRATELLQQLAP